MAFSIVEVPGLLFMPDVLTADEERTLLRQLRDEPGHPVHQVHPAHEFGWCFAKRCPIGRLTVDDYLGPLPDVLVGLWFLCVERAHLPPPMTHVAVPDHALVNVYAPGDYCAQHVDDVVFWQDWVVGVSLGSGATLEMCRPREGHCYPTTACAASLLKGGGGAAMHSAACEAAASVAGARQRHTMWLPPRSIYVLTGEARYQYSHAITAALSDTVDGQQVQRQTRTSITFRTIGSRVLRPALRAEALALSSSTRKTDTADAKRKPPQKRKS